MSVLVGLVFRVQTSLANGIVGRKSKKGGPGARGKVDRGLTDGVDMSDFSGEAYNTFDSL